MGIYLAIAFYLGLMLRHSLVWHLHMIIHQTGGLEKSEDSLPEIVTVYNLRNCYTSKLTWDLATSLLWLLLSSHHCPFYAKLNVDINSTVHRAASYFRMCLEVRYSDWDGVDGVMCSWHALFTDINSSQQ